MGTLHIFNPEHDIALASNLSNFTAPHAGRQLRADLGFLPMLWARPGDAVLVERAEYAERVWNRLSKRIHATVGLDVATDVRFIQPSGRVRDFDAIDAVEPWGWDKALVAQLQRQGLDPALLPSANCLERVRELSHRRVASQLLPRLRQEGTVGESYECTTADEVKALLARYGQVVMKAPWSSSGRGLRFLSVDRTPFVMQAGWFRHVVADQGSVIVEPYYNKVRDFGMEFESTEQGIRYLGLSLFHTVNGAYTGNILATEKWKQSFLMRYVSASLLCAVRETISHCLDLGDYRGPFGMDMMVVRVGSQLFLHPCVEINLRCTMGHVALALSPSDDDVVKVMRIRLNDHYRLSIRQFI